ncbi:G2/mitotic-specific cyclin-B3-like isoform X2 [Oratosquilla oratoria]|uniref:G2/mitotic-specific cyclin-B3-like isoform X2 n=1 Tax=Oratosquilla oratoria TaxID=337810 RepID=UPI003F771B8F
MLLTMTTRNSKRGLSTRDTNTVHTQNENLTRLHMPGKTGAKLDLLKNTTTKVLRLKRKATNAPEEKIPKKRSAFGDITNALEKKNETVKLKQVRGIATTKFSSQNSKNTKVKLTASKCPPVPVAPSAPVVDEQDNFCDALPSSHETFFSSQESNKTELDESAAYTTASEESPVIQKVNTGLKVIKEEAVFPEGVVDFDKETKDDPFAVSDYVMDIFSYYKEREAIFPVNKYIENQPDISRSMRIILVDWMVEVQESFELNHETLYLAVKLVDLYLSKVVIKRESLQLVGSTALFIACKFDERVPPYVDDFLYICDDAYKRRELILMEMKMLKTIGFDLGIPLSYRFLRRFARCAKVSMEDLTFARYILEMSLMEYDLIDASDSMLGASALYLALKIKHSTDWTPCLEYYSGYKKEDLYHMVHVLHNMVSQQPKSHIMTIRNKYSHKVFFEVAKTEIPEDLEI